MRIVVLKRLKAMPSVHDTRNIGVRGSASGTSGPTDEVRVEIVDDVSRKDVADLQRDPTVEAVATSMPIRLIRPAARIAAASAAATRGGAAWGVEAVGALSASRTGLGVKVAILDTGIETTHPAFSGLTFNGFNTRNFTGTGTVEDVHDEDGHGTHCAGTIFGRHVNGMRIGVAPGVSEVLIAKVIGKDGGGFEGIADAVQWAYAHGAHILSMSLGMDFDAHLAALQAQDGMPRAQATSQALVDYGSCVRLFDRLCEFVADRNDTQRGMLIVAAAGNESDRPKCVVTVPPPADAFGIVSVAAVGRSMADTGGKYFVAPFSNRGAHFCAPGLQIVSAGLEGGLATMDGTSMAAPHVAGVAALWAEPRVAASRYGIVRRGQLLEDIRRSTCSFPHLGSDDVGEGFVMAPQ